ncbi:hypothetical protein DRE_04645 [Drechslerella stenobrocha 248]|uniref:Uncharacterized protein n=1 Tax=Drechslerella stenobrocha 248 TaxID=1043628 RepID=W7HPM4_9PEZI|nr:hypothetical protein DRE_04645 [Drechslerella stenobrocha 248]
MATSTNIKTLRHRKSTSEPPSPSCTALPLTGTGVVPLMERSASTSTSMHVTTTSLSLTSLLTTLTTTEGITTTARKLYSYPTKRLSASDLWRRYKSDEDRISDPPTPPPDYDYTTLTQQPSSPSPPQEIALRTPGTTITTPEEDAGVVSAKFAMQGHNLLALSLAEPPTSTFRRHMYLDSLTYLLRALPADLSYAEAAQLRASLPPAVVASGASSQPTAMDVDGNGYHRLVRPAEHPTVHYLLAVVTAATVMSVRRVAPHVRVLARSTWEYNVRHRVAERGVEVVRGAVDSGWAFWKAVAEWVMVDAGEGEEMMVDEKGVVVMKRGYGRGLVRDVGRYASGVVRSGVGGVVEGRG